MANTFGEMPHSALVEYMLKVHKSIHTHNIRYAIFTALMEGLSAISIHFPGFSKRITGIGRWVYVWVLKLLTPTFPFDPKKGFLDHYWWIFFSGLALGYILSFGANWFGSWLSGTLIGPDTATVEYFWTDRQNLAIYLLWAPLYCAFSFTVVLLVARDWPKLKQFADEVSHYKDTDIDIARLPFSVNLLFWFALVITILDYGAVINTDYTRSKIYWYISEIGNNKYRLNAAGYFHFVSNFLKMALVIAAVLAYISFCIEILRTAANASRDHAKNEGLRTRYAQFLKNGEKLFLNMFFLAIVLCCHHLIWRDQVSGKNSLNIAFAHVAIILGVIFMVEMPRYYIIRLAKKKEYAFYDVHTELFGTLFAFNAGIIFFCGRLALYLYIWGFYFEEQLGFSSVSRLAQFMYQTMHKLDPLFNCILGRPCG